MRREDLDLYRRMLGTTGDIPQEVSELHARFSDYLKGFAKGAVTPTIAALILALSVKEETSNGKRVTVDGRPGTYISKWKAGTVRVKFDDDDKAFRVISEADVKYE
jgi:hypothetical protein